MEQIPLPKGLGAKAHWCYGYSKRRIDKQYWWHVSAKSLRQTDMTGGGWVQSPLGAQACDIIG